MLVNVSNTSVMSDTHTNLRTGEKLSRVFPQAELHTHLFFYFSFFFIGMKTEVIDLRLVDEENLRIKDILEEFVHEI